MLEILMFLSMTASLHCYVRYEDKMKIFYKKYKIDILIIIIILKPAENRKHIQLSL